MSSQYHLFCIRRPIHCFCPERLYTLPLTVDTGTAYQISAYPSACNSGVIFKQPYSSRLSTAAGSLKLSDHSTVSITVYYNIVPIIKFKAKNVNPSKSTKPTG